VLIVDELDASLHPELAAETIRMFYDRRLNTGGAQLLFSSHDVTMLGTTYGSPLLHRDQVWFTDKNDEGATELYPLADFKPRKGENVERGYLAGRYGAVPGLSPGELARTLWPPDAGEDGA
jgi:AAA15 family ATPase/GTPase